MQIIRAARQCLALMPLDPHVRDAIIVCVRQFPNAGWRGNVQRTVIPQATLGKHNLVREDSRFVESSIAIRVFQAHDPMRFLLELLVGFVIRPRRIRHIQPPLFIV